MTAATAPIIAVTTGAPVLLADGICGDTLVSDTCNITSCLRIGQQVRGCSSFICIGRRLCNMPLNQQGGFVICKRWHLKTAGTLEIDKTNVYGIFDVHQMKRASECNSTVYRARGDSDSKSLRLNDAKRKTLISLKCQTNTKAKQRKLFSPKTAEMKGNPPLGQLKVNAATKMSLSIRICTFSTNK